MCITVEPGCYFVDHLLKQAADNPVQARLMDFEVIDKYRDIGGVRLEDDVVVTDEGVRNLTVVPRAVEDVEELVQLGLHAEHNFRFPVGDSFRSKACFFECRADYALDATDLSNATFLETSFPPHLQILLNKA
ncbi:hypothetical protein Esti_000357 [Eimeria stiedai]